MWKPGQIVTVNHKKYRVKSTKKTNKWLGCSFCDFDDSGHISRICARICYRPHTKLDDYSYLEEIHPAKG